MRAFLIRLLLLILTTVLAAGCALLSGQPDDLVGSGDDDPYSGDDDDAVGDDDDDDDDDATDDDDAADDDDSFPDDDDSTGDDDDAADDDDSAGDDDDSSDDDDSADDDDSSDDDDDSSDDDDDSSDDDDAADDDDSGDDDDSAGPAACSPEAETGQPACATAPTTTLSLDVLLGICPEGDYFFEDAGDWGTFLGTTCWSAPFADPLASFDWTTADVMGRITGASGCDAYGGMNWVAQCGSSWHFSDWIEGCGECDGWFQEAHFVSVPEAATAPTFHQCTPGSFTCPS